MQPIQLPVEEQLRQNRSEDDHGTADHLVRRRCGQGTGHIRCRGEMGVDECSLHRSLSRVEMSSQKSHTCGIPSTIRHVHYNALHVKASHQMCRPTLHPGARPPADQRQLVRRACRGERTSSSPTDDSCLRMGSHAAGLTVCGDPQHSRQLVHYASAHSITGGV